MGANKSSGYIHHSRSAIPKPSPDRPKIGKGAAPIRFTQEELSRRATGFRGVGPPVKR